MKKLFLFTLMIFLLAWPKATSAQDGVAIDLLEISLWPEFDRPEMLVITRVHLGEDTPLPTEVTLLMPTIAGVPYAVALEDANGALINAEYQRQVDGIWTAITIVTNSPVVQMEYYDPSLQREGTLRNYQFIWVGGYDVAQVAIKVQQPVGAEAMSITPDLGEGSVEGDGLVYYRSALGSLGVGEAFTLGMQYQKEGHALSAFSQPQPGSAGGAVSAGEAAFSTWVPLALGVLIGAVTVLASLRFSRASAPKIETRELVEADMKKELGERPGEGEEGLEAEDAARLAALSQREREVIALVAEGLTSAEVGESLGISPKTVARHRERIFKKLEVSSLPDLVRFAIRTGLIEL